jgi:hypothetical protein
VKKVQKVEDPGPPFVWVINDTRSMMRDIAEQSGVRYRVGPHRDGDRYTYGMYVHYDDLEMLRRWFRDTGQLAEEAWTQETIDRGPSG